MNHLIKPVRPLKHTLEFYFLTVLVVAMGFEVSEAKETKASVAIEPFAISLSHHIREPYISFSWIWNPYLFFIWILCFHWISSLSLTRQSTPMWGSNRAPILSSQGLSRSAWAGRWFHLELQSPALGKSTVSFLWLLQVSTVPFPWILLDSANVHIR